MHFIIVLCRECHEVPIVASPRYGFDKASQWEGMLMCPACAEKRGSLLKKEVPA